MNCRNCGNTMSPIDKFCKACGAPAPVAGQSQQAQQQPQQQAQQNYGYQQNNYQQPQYNYQQPQYNQQGGYNYQQAHYANQAPGYGYGQPRPGVSFGDAVKLYFSNYANFNGRARRSEYWYAYLFTFLVNFILTMILPELTYVTGLVFFLPSLAICVRRLHDIGKSGWNALWVLLPLAGAIVLLIFECTDSVPGDNQYGPSTKY